MRLGDDVAEAFHRAHEERYGYADRTRPVELVAVRRRTSGAGPDVTSHGRGALSVSGPDVAELEGATCWVPARLGRQDGRPRHARPGARVNVELQVIGAALRAVADEMGAVLVRSAFSPNVKERRDCSTALFDEDGRMVAQAEHIPVHLGAMPHAVAAVLEATPPRARRGS